jgi:preprotein translocase subunit SecE
MNKLTTYLHESIAEMKKVVWPTKKQTTTYTLIVIGLSLGIAFILGALDYIFNIGLTQLIK